MAGPVLPQLLSTYVRMLATSSSLSWLIGGMTESYCLPLTVTGPVRPFSTTSIVRDGLPARKSDLASGGNTSARPWPFSWWHVEHVPLKSTPPASTCCALVNFPCALACTAVVTDARLDSLSLRYISSTCLPE